MIGKFKPIISVFMFIFLISFIFLSFQISPSQAASGKFGEGELRISEHRLSIVQDENTNLFTVYDEFWITNIGEEPYYNLVYNSLPEEIAMGRR